MEELLPFPKQTSTLQCPNFFPPPSTSNGAGIRVQYLGPCLDKVKTSKEGPLEKDLLGKDHFQVKWPLEGSVPCSLFCCPQRALLAPCTNKRQLWGQPRTLGTGLPKPHYSSLVWEPGASSSEEHQYGKGRLVALICPAGQQLIILEWEGLHFIPTPLPNIPKWPLGSLALAGTKAI